MSRSIQEVQAKIKELKEELKALKENCDKGYKNGDLVLVDYPSSDSEHYYEVWVYQNGEWVDNISNYCSTYANLAAIRKEYTNDSFTAQIRRITGMEFVK